MTSEPRSYQEGTLRESKTVRQHVVPRFYLSSFSEEGLLGVLDLESGNTFRTSVTNVAVVSHFYDLEVGGQAVSSEDWLSIVEARCAAVLAKLAKKPRAIASLRLTEELDLSRFLAAQIFRVRAFRAWEESMRKQAVQGIKNIAEGYIRKQAGDAADDAWEIWDSEPDWRWLQQSGPSQDAEISTAMMQEVQGWANIIRALPWRVGTMSGDRTLYTSDNPVAGYLPPLRPFWSGGAIWEYVYYFPIAPALLMMVGPYGYAASRKRKGQRICRDFSDWECSFARHVISASATRFLYGDGPYVTRDCANACLPRLSRQKTVDAARLHGFVPSTRNWYRAAPPESPRTLTEYAGEPAGTENRIK